MARCKVSRFLRALPRAVCLVATAALLRPATAAADHFNAFTEFNYANSILKTSGEEGTERSSSNLFQQRYNVTLGKDLFPMISIEGGGVFERNDTDFRGKNSSTSSSTQFSPFVNLLWRDRTFPASAGYQRREERSETNGSPSPTQIMESYNLNLGWNPLELPAWHVQYLRTDRYDTKRTATNASSDSLQWGTSFNPVEEFTFAYQGSVLTDTDHLALTKAEYLNQSIRMAYSDRFFDSRVNVASTYNLGFFTNTFSSLARGEGAEGTGTFLIPVLSFNSGPLSAVTSPTSSTRVESGALGGFVPTNLVTPAIPLPGTQYNFGLDFGRAVTVSTLYLPLVSGSNSRPANAGSLVSLFPFAVYTSDDGKEWSLSQPAVVPVLGPHPIGAADTVGFILNIAPVNKRFLKVVVTPVQRSSLIPLLAGVADIDPGNLTVTGLQAFSTQNQPGQGNSVTSRGMGGNYTFSMTANLLPKANLFYDTNLTLNHATSEQGSSMGYLLNNGLSASHRFGKIFSAMARGSFNISSQGDLQTRNLSGSLALTATPLRTLNHSLVYSTQVGYSGGGRTSSNSVFLNNTAQLYQGAALYLSSGFSTTKDVGGRVSESTIFNTGVTLTPHRTVSLDGTYGQTASKSSGGGVPDSSGGARTISTSASYHPFELVYLQGRWSLFKQQNQPTTTSQSYGVTWSPFPGGALQLNLTYNEGLTLPSGSRERGGAASAQWLIRPGITLNSSYAVTRSTSGSGSVQVNSFSTLLRISL